jgi:hypothetical protein
MNAQKLLNEILPILFTVKEDPVKLQKILQFLLDEIYEEPEEEDEIEVPEKYLKAVSEIADGIDAGFVCFLNMDTLEVEDVPKEMVIDPEDYELITGISPEEADLKYPTWENVLTFEPLQSNESFDIMRKFTERMADQKLQSKLIYALNNRKPFANFKFIIDNSQYRQEWFDFKKHCLEIHVKELLSMELDKQEASFE